MAEGKKKYSWEIPAPGPGTISGFFVAWVFVAGIIGLAVFFMAIGKGPMPVRVAAYDMDLEGIAPGQVEVIMAETTPWVERMGAKSDVLRRVMRGELEVSKGAEEIRVGEQEVRQLLQEPRVLAQKVIRGEMNSTGAARRLGVDEKEVVGKKSFAEAELKRLTAAIGQTNPMVLALDGTSEKLTKEVSRKLELSHFVSEGSSAILSKYPIEESEGAGAALIRYGKVGRFGVISTAARNGPGGQRLDLKEAVELARKEFGESPHAIVVLVSGMPAVPPPGYLEMPVAIPAKEKAASDWQVFIPEAIKENLKECYVPADNKVIKDFSDRLPIVTRFVFRKRDFE